VGELDHPSNIDNTNADAIIAGSILIQITNKKINKIIAIKNQIYFFESSKPHTLIHHFDLP
jgi:hypothetical protein